MNFESEYILFDIDGTITRYVRTDFPRLHGNFLFPIFADLLVESGCNRAEAEAAIGQLMNDVVFWDYTDFIADLGIDRDEAFRRCNAWHDEYIEPYADMVAAVKELYAQGKKLCIISNNPLQGCLWKLKRAGLADDFTSKWFTRIFATNIVRGCKCRDEVWKRVLTLIPTSPENIAVVGDNPVEDHTTPEKFGVREFLTLDRTVIQRGIDGQNGASE